ncbi:MAG TPA: GlsB/YeaQ/YmgE family stress response membrane protein [Gaiella sp.]|nr:GlsB/YeaQ/YmgE family stress response membrane protein [Gaiella sp.]
MGIIGWIAIGLVAGIIAKAIYPGAEDFGIILTILLGIAGALLGGFVAWLVGAGDPIDEFFDISTWIASIVGALVVLVAYSALGGSRTSRRVI